VQVTHSEVNARYGRRIIELRDGWMTRDEILEPKATEADTK
jgi:ABC-type lipoprotein export system ATPase subunit